mgnify:CR=1 FL=1
MKKTKSKYKDKFDFIKKAKDKGKDTYLLLGPQEVGKTCFLTGMYYSFRSSLNGFGISCVNDEQRLTLNKMCADLNSGKFPTGTSGANKFDFQLRYAHEIRFKFEWYDYRGKLLEEYGLDNPKEYEELIDIVNDSTCILICLDGTWFTNDKNSTVKNIQDNSYAVNELLNKYVDKNKKLPPICIVITKFDLCDIKYEQMFYEAIKESFPLFENSQTPVFICPICVGKDDLDSGKFKFNPIDQDVYRPLFFALWCGYGYRVAEYKKWKSSLYMPIKNLKEKNKKLLKKINSVPYFKKRIENIDDFFEIIDEEVRKLELEQKSLLDNISGAENIYFGGKQTTWEEVEQKWKFIQ